MKIALSFSTSLRALGNAYAEPLAAATLQLLHAETGANAAYVSMGLEGFWGRSLGGDLWLVFGEHGGERVVCFAGDHAAATRFASTHRLKAHPETGHAQLVELPGASATSAQPNRLAARSIESLLGAGVPAEWIDTLQTLPDFALGGALAQLPEEARLAVLSWVSPEASPAEEIDVRPRAFAEATDATLGHLLRAPWAEWLVFLHPSQRSIVESEYPRPVLVHGSAGTGKTVVALHRAAHLAKRSGGARVLLTTFTRTLVSSLAARLDQLMHDAPEARTRVVVAGVHQLAWRHAATRASLARREHVVQELERAMKEVLPPEEIDLGYVLAEWDEVVAPQDIRTEKAYLRAFRRGRPVLGERKHWIWSVFSKAREGLRARGLATHQDVCRQARLRLDGALFDHAVIDEAQDLSVAELGFLRSLVEPGADDLFFTSDAAQRLYWRPLPWKKARVQHLKPELVGLTVNYRTSERIRQAAEAVVPEGLRGPDNAVEARHAGSLSLGREVVYAGSPTEVAALDQLGRWLDQLFDDSFAPGDVAIFQHYTLDKAPGARNLCLSKGLEVTTTDARSEG
ncbi:MAG: UvrD-helicase domain-containing protein, partial [Pseudomonadota bacterium]